MTFKRPRPGENGRAGIALFLRAVPVGRVFGGPELLHVVGRAFGFLQAEDVGLLGVEKFQKVFLQHGAQAVDVPRNQFHGPKNEPLSETHSNIRGKALKVKDYSIPNLVKRFQLTLVGREMLNGRPSLVVDFKPASNDLPANSLADKFINKAAGRVWIDEADYAIVQAQIYLTQQVNVLGGLVGAVWKFTYGFTRLRTPEGYWFARRLDWHLEGREVVFNRIVDYHERKLNEQKIITLAMAH
jgi:hypothetical protein